MKRIHGILLFFLSFCLGLYIGLRKAPPHFRWFARPMSLTQLHLAYDISEEMVYSVCGEPHTYFGSGFIKPVYWVGGKSVAVLLIDGSLFHVYIYASDDAEYFRIDGPWW